MANGWVDFLKLRQVPLLYTVEDFERDRLLLKSALGE